MQVNTFTAVLQDTRLIAPRVRHFVFALPEDVAFEHEPGQFITIHFSHGEKTLRRSYSIANPPSNSKFIEFAAGFVEGGPASQLLFNLKPGESVQMNGPFGRLVLKPENPKRLVLVATSTGVTPYLAMLDTLKARLQADPALEVVVLEGVRKREDLLYGDVFRAFAGECERVRFIPCFSQEAPASLQNAERAGYVQENFTHLALHPERDLVYLCGNPGMIDNAFDWLKANGFASQNVIREKYLSR
ncbi:ferredoxin--NADP reductase [Legionella geestiana]|uniref:ferredoxin--NADP reductase n=1 Tax=Legionella geestiana TaxID=45065 RepID=UPI0010928B77|nr:ferredoxin--NADP reductase [Legionella geestiana]QDQ40435.1 ferredoxin--NADP reductase [Legionella geestiana]